MFKNKITDLKSKKDIGHYYETLLWFLIICGFDYDFFKFKSIIKLLIKLYCVALIIFISVASLTCCVDQGSSQNWSLVEYVSSTLIVLFINNKISIFFHRLTNIDTRLRISTKYYLRKRIQRFLIIFLIWSIRIVYTTFYCVYYPCYSDLSMYIVNLFSLLALDVNRVWRYALYDEIRIRLKTLRNRLEEHPDNCYLYVVNNKSVKEDKARFCLDIYKSIADAMDLIVPELHASLLMSVICSLPKLVMNVYHILLVIENDLPYESAGFMVMHILQISFFIFSPCVVAELYASEIEKIRKLLMHRLIKETDATTKSDLQLFLSYTHLRNFHYKIWRVIPVNLSLPLELINLCTTYVIVVINFTHLYG